ncbi:MAG: hypothetical protein Q8P73_02900 [bacterium]|nr:hypothetical protein [bacterium]
MKGHGFLFFGVQVIVDHIDERCGLFGQDMEVPMIEFSDEPH